MSFQPSLYRVYQSFLLSSPSIVSSTPWSSLHLHGRVTTQSPGDVAGHAYIPKHYKFACDTTFACSAGNNCILKRDRKATNMTYAELIAIHSLLCNTRECRPVILMRCSALDASGMEAVEMYMRSAKLWTLNPCILGVTTLSPKIQGFRVQSFVLRMYISTASIPEASNFSQGATPLP